MLRQRYLYTHYRRPAVPEFVNGPLLLCSDEQSSRRELLRLGFRSSIPLR